MSSLDDALRRASQPLERAVDLGGLVRAPEQAPPPPDIKVCIVPRHQVQAYLDVNQAFPSFGIYRPDGKAIPALMFTSLDDKVMRVYLLDEPQIDVLADFLEKCKAQKDGTEFEPESEPAPEPEVSDEPAQSDPAE